MGEPGGPERDSDAWRYHDDPAGVPIRALNRLGVSYCLDTCLVIDLVTNDASSELEELVDLCAKGWLTLAVTDVVGTEVNAQTGEALPRWLEERGVFLPEVLGPMVLGHSRLDHAVWASADDQERLDAIFAEVKPSDADLPRDERNPHDQRDAMHVATSSRFGYDGLLTWDDSLLKASPRLTHTSVRFRITTPVEALAFVQRLKGRFLVRHRASG